MPARDWRPLYEQAHAQAEREHSRADAAEARARSLSDDVFLLGIALDVAKGANKTLRARVAKFRAAGAALSKLPFDEAAHLRNVLRRLRRQKAAIEPLSRENARLRRTVTASQTRIEKLEGQYVRLRASTAVLQKALFGSRSEQQEKRSSRTRAGLRCAMATRPSGASSR